jgi:tetratricopeptide (TPR) repeat protein
VHHALKQNQQAERLFKLALEQPGPPHPRARYLLALTQIDQGKLLEAENLLRDIRASPGAPEEPEEIRQSLFALGHVLYRRGNYLGAASRLQEALELYPRDPQALAARYWLAESYRQAARQGTSKVSPNSMETTKDYFLRQRQGCLSAALKHFRFLADELDDRRKHRALTQEEEGLFRESRFGLGECHFYLGQYNEAISIYARLAEDYRNRVEGLTALMRLADGYCSARQPEQAERTIELARRALANLNDVELKLPQLTRRSFQEWIDRTASNCQASRLPRAK